MARTRLRRFPETQSSHLWSSEEKIMSLHFPCVKYGAATLETSAQYDESWALRRFKGAGGVKKL
jgi:hypothetical protein